MTDKDTDKERAGKAEEESKKRKQAEGHTEKHTEGRHPKPRKDTSNTWYPPARAPRERQLSLSWRPREHKEGEEANEEKQAVAAGVPVRAASVAAKEAKDEGDRKESSALRGQQGREREEGGAAERAENDSQGTESNTRNTNGSEQYKEHRRPYRHNPNGQKWTEEVC